MTGGAAQNCHGAGNVIEDGIKPQRRRALKIRWLFTAMAAAGLVLPPAASPAAAEPEGGPVFISLTRAEAPLDRMPSNVSVMTQDDIAATGARMLDEALDHLLSADVARAGTLGSPSTLRLRGVPSSAQTQVVVDDRPAGGTSVQSTDVSQIPVDMIERIEVVRGAAAMLYGANTIGGVVHVITKRHAGEQARSSIAIDARSFKTQIYRADLGVAGGGFDGYVNAGRYFTDGFQENARAENTNVFGRGGYSFANGARVSADVSHVNHDAGDPRGTLVPLDQWDGKKERPAADPTRRLEQDTNAARFKAETPLGGAASVQTTFYGSDQDLRAFPAAGAPASSDQNNLIVGNDTRVAFRGGLLLGGSYQREEQETAGAGAAHVTDWGAYLQQSVTLGAWDLIPAVRLDQHGSFGHIVNPRFTAVFRAGEDWTLSANAARSFRAPSFAELFFRSPAFNGNPDLRPETAWTYDLGAARRVSDTRVVRLTGFHTRIRERIAATAASYVNAPRAEVSGAELESAARFGPLTETLNYAYHRALGSSLASSGFVALRLTPRHLANYRLDWRLPRDFTLSNSVQYVHSQHEFDDLGGIKLPSYTLWNVRLSKRILGAELYAAVDNLTDKRYAEAFGAHPVTSATTLLPQPGRTYWGGITIRFLD